MLNRIIMATAAAVLTATAAVSQNRPVEIERDSLNRALAIAMKNTLDPVIANLTKSGLDIDRALLGQYLGKAIAGDDLGMTAQEATVYVDAAMLAAARLSDESQQAFLANAAAQPGATVTPSGLVFQVITEGEGVTPLLHDKVDVKYVGRFSDGNVFDDTAGETVTFDLGNEIAGFTEGLQMMKPGGTYRLTIPAALAYGEQGIPGIIPPNAALEFTVTLDAVRPSEQ